METPEEFYRQLEKMRLEFRDLGYNLLALIEAYQQAGFPFGQTGKGYRVWIEHRQWTTVN